MLTARSDGRVDVMCSRCLVSAIVDSHVALAELGWELRAERQTWCIDCSAKARAPKERPNARGVIRRRRRR